MTLSFVIFFFHESKSIKTKHIKIIQNNLSYLLNDEDNTAKVIYFNSKQNIGQNIFIPRSITYESREYLITTISRFAFRNSQIFSLSFPSDSKLKKIEKSAFLNSSIERLMIPSSLVEFEEGWSYSTRKLNKIEVSPNNPYYSIYGDKYIIGKSSLDRTNYDILVFSVRNIEIAIIPGFIEIIGSYSFYECTELQSVEIPVDSKLRIISNNAFYDCAFESFYIPRHVTLIDERSFYFCEYLETIEIPDDSELITIGNVAFGGTRLQSITIPSKLTDLKSEWCWNTIELNDIKVDPRNPRYSSYEGKYIIGKSTLDKENYDVLVFAVRNIKKAKIPDFIEIIGKCAFERCVNLKNIETSKNSNLKIIDEYDFNDSYLENITIPSKFVEFKKGWCAGIRYLNYINVMPNNHNFSFLDEKFIVGKSSPDNINYDILIYSIRNIVKAKIPDFIRIISSNAFNLCESLRQVELSPNSQLTIIDNYAFHQSFIMNITLPKSLKKICKCSFSICKNLKRIEIPFDSELQTIEEDGFTFSSIEFFTFPRNLKSIGKNAFSFCAIKSIIIPSNLIEIEDGAFSSCKNLQIVEFEENCKIKNINQNVFKKCKKLIIMIPVKLHDQINFYNNKLAYK